ncbi:MAG: spore coat protein CotJB [Clostridia bacterium]|nr:spore coat protein CotJB [Oscillospiraceae bacterium]MBR2412009.1 spore coat protein CotJB [Clostridia bacterium]
MNSREKLLRNLSSTQFALWELHLYLNTHPGDLTALGMHEKYALKFRQLKEEYEENYGPLTARSGEGIEWLKNPWPWDVGGCDG